MRLYFTGKYRTIIVTSKSPGMNCTSYGACFLSHYEIGCKELNYTITLGGKEGDTLSKGTKLRAFASDLAKRGFITNKRQAGLFACFVADYGNPLLPLILLPIFYLLLTIHAITLFKYSIIERLKEYKANNRPTYPIKDALRLIKEFVPDTLIIVIIFALSLIASKAVLSVESVSEFQTACVLELSGLAIIYCPFLVLRFKFILATNPTLEIAVLLTKITIGLYTFKELISFSYKNMRYESFEKLLQEFVKYLTGG
jgi:hypothetical protein